MTSESVGSYSEPAQKPKITRAEAIHKMDAILKSHTPDPYEQDDSSEDVDIDDSVESVFETEDESTEEKSTPEIKHKEIDIAHDPKDYREAMKMGLSEDDILSLTPFGLKRKLKELTTERDSQKPKEEPKKSSATPYKVNEAIESEYGSEIAAEFAKVHESALSQINEMRQLVNNVLTEIVKERATDNERKIDQFFDGLQGHEDLFGKGPIGELSESEKADQRRAVVEKAIMLQSAYRAHNKKVPTLEKLLEESLIAMYPEKIKEKAKKEMAEKNNKRANQSLARANAMNPPPDIKKKSDKSAAASVKTKADAIRGIRNILESARARS